MLLMGAQGENADLMWTVSSDSFPFHSQLMESYVSFVKNATLFFLFTFCMPVQNKGVHM